MIVMCRVTGYFAFGSRNDASLRERIMTGRFVDSGRFSTLTEECRHLVSKMLEVNPDERYSAEEALNHGWFTIDKESDVDSIPSNIPNDVDSIPSNIPNDIVPIPSNMPSDCDRSAMVSSKRMNE